MATATKKQEEKKTSKQTDTKPVEFFSKAVSLRVTLAPQQVIRDSATGLIDQEKSRKGDAVEFEGHVLVLDPNAEGDDVQDPYKPGGSTVKPGDLNKKRIKQLRDHPRFNVTFWEHGNAPDEPEPRLKQQLQTIREGAKAKDAPTVREALDLEQQTHQRAAVISAAQSVLDALDEDSESAPSQPTSDS
jgi:hypothetical protein